MKGLFTVLMLSIASGPVFSQGARMLPDVTPEGKGRVNTMVDNIGYWTKMTRLGYVKPSPSAGIPKVRFTGTMIISYLTPHDSSLTTLPSRLFPHDSSLTPHASRLFTHDSSITPLNSPDIPVTGETDVTQTENSVFIDPMEEGVVLNSNNSTGWVSGYAQDPYGADALYSFDEGQDWGGSTRGVSGNNNGDPSTAIGLNGWWYVGRITGDWGQAVSYSKDHGTTWTRVKVGQGPQSGNGLLDKNHLCIDNSPESPFKGNLYAAWTNLIAGNPDTNQVELVRSTDLGLTWSSPLNISSAASAQKSNQGVNLSTGPAGEVYAAFSIYDSWPLDETAIGFARSVDGGGIFMPATRIISNIKGIRASMTGKNMRVNSFPSMAVDNSNGPNRGTIYLVWANVGYPGINTGSDIDVYMIRSADGGSGWSAPIRVNQDPAGLGKEHFFPWITCDAVTGGLCVIYYDDRNVDSTMVEVFVSISYDGGNTWNDMKVSDFAFTPQPVPGLSFSYFGDYLGIQSENMKVYPVWTDNHDGGRPMTYTSPFDLGPNPNQPWVTYYSDSLATVSGTGNVLMTNGDSLHLSLGLKNIGDQPAAAVNAVISSASPFISITDSIAGYDTILPGGAKIVPDGFTFRVSDTIPDNLMVRFDIRASNADTAWYSHFSIESHAPALHISGIALDDSLPGNQNGRLDPGETIRVIVPTANTGDFNCSGTYGLLTTTCPWLTLVDDSVYLGDIQPGTVKNAEFTVLVSPETPAGSGADIAYAAYSGLYGSQRTFREMVGMIVEDWESNTFTKFQWRSGGAKPWSITGIDPWQGNYCSRSGPIPDYSNSQMYLTYTSVADDSISFYLATSSEQDYDFLLFYIDAVLQGQWSGETPWMRAAFPVAAGQHTFRWTYQKDIAYTSGQDCARVDYITLPPPVLPVVDPGPDDTICAGQDVLLQATAQHYDSVRWNSAGDGVFSNDTMLITTYTPGTDDLVSGHVTLRLTGYGTFGNSGKNKRIVVNPLPVASISVFPHDTVCAGQSVILTADTAGAVSWQWMPGNFILPEVTYDTSSAGGTGTHLIRLLVTSLSGCRNRDSVSVTFKDCAGIGEYSASPVRIYPNPGDGRIMLEVDTRVPGPIRILITNELNAMVFRMEDPSRLLRHTEKINLTFLPDGLYLLSLTTPEGTSTRKIIIRK